MKTIIDCKINSLQIVKKLHTTGALRQRLISFGILKGAEIKFLATTILKGTCEIEIGKMRVALGRDEARKIEVVV